MAAWTDSAGSSPSCFISAWHLSQRRTGLFRSAGCGGTFPSPDAMFGRPLKSFFFESVTSDCYIRVYNMVTAQLKLAGEPRKADRTCRLFFFFCPQQLAARSVDEMKAAAGLADHSFVIGGGIVRSGIVSQPVLHVHTGARTFEDNMTHKFDILASKKFFCLDPCQCFETNNVLAAPSPGNQYLVRLACATRNRD